MDLVARVLQSLEARPPKPDEFERCACALLQAQYPGLSGIEQGHDFGRDADIYFQHEAGRVGRLTATVGDPVANLRTGLRRMREEKLSADLVVVACLREINATARRKLAEVCADYGLPAPHIYGRDWFVARLVGEPDW